MDQQHTRYPGRLRVGSPLQVDTIRKSYPIEKIVYANKVAWHPGHTDP